MLNQCDVIVFLQILCVLKNVTEKLTISLLFTVSSLALNGLNCYDTDNEWN